MAGCGEVTLEGDEPDCLNLPSGGTEPEIFIGSHDELDEFGEDVEGIITSCTMISGKKLARYTGFRNDMKKTDEVAKPELGPNQFKHGIGWIIYNRTQTIKNEIEALARKRVFAFIPNKGQDAAAWELYGKKVGLEMVVGPLRNAHENGGFFTINFATPVEDGEYETKLPQTFMTDYDAAKDALETLLVAS